MPVSSKTDLPLSKAEPIYVGGSTSVKTYLRREKNCCGSANGREEWEYVRNISTNTMVSEQGGGGGGLGVRVEIPLQPVVKTVVSHTVALQPMTVNDGADMHL